MDSTPTIKKLRQLKQKAQAPIGQAGKVHTTSEVISERPRGTLKLPPAKFNAVPSPSRIKSPVGIDKQSNTQRSTKSLERSYSIESMDSNRDHIVASLDLEGITNNYKTWNRLTNELNPLFKCYLQTIHFKSKNEITDNLISHISCIFI